jgi:hypothetical protein
VIHAHLIQPYPSLHAQDRRRKHPMRALSPRPPPLLLPQMTRLQLPPARLITRVRRRGGGDQALEPRGGGHGAQKRAPAGFFSHVTHCVCKNAAFELRGGGHGAQKRAPAVHGGGESTRNAVTLLVAYIFLSCGRCECYSTTLRYVHTCPCRPHLGQITPTQLVYVVYGNGYASGTHLLNSV